MTEQDGATTTSTAQRETETVTTEASLPDSGQIGDGGTGEQDGSEQPADEAGDGDSADDSGSSDSE